MITWLAVKAFLGKLPWRWITAGILALALVLTGVRIREWRHAYFTLPYVQKALQAERDCKPDTRCAERVQAWQADGIIAVEKARQAAQEAAGREQARRDAEVREETDRLTAAASAARVKADAWRRKYEAAKLQPECAKWAEQPISCPAS